MKAPTPPKGPKLKIWNENLARFLGIDPTMNRAELERIFSGTLTAKNSKPLAMAYAGHQFGHFNPELGDGRAHLLGELLGKDGAYYDIQLKGSGQSQFSRRGDGLSPLGPVIREYLVSEAMYYLGVPTTRSLAVVETEENVYRDAPLNGGVLTRVAESHIRIGHFEYFAHRNDLDNLRVLIQFLIQRSYPNLIEAKDKPLALFEAIARKQASLVAQWMSLGFVHGVMNTDNTSASGITLDFGPCAFLDETNFEKVFSSIDRQGRYAYGRQPALMQWNLTRLAEALLFTYPEDQRDQRAKDFENHLEEFIENFNGYWRSLFSKKIGFKIDLTGSDAKILEKWLEYFNEEQIDFTQGFRGLSQLLTADLTSPLTSPLTSALSFEEPSNDKPSNAEPIYTEPSSIYVNSSQFKELVHEWQKLVLTHSTSEDSQQLMDSVNPVMIPRNHVIERIIQACYKGDYIEFENFAQELKTPFMYTESKAPFVSVPKKSERVTQTFCGT
jgi:serine/tyrosine/threonine adenylyltransferase